MTDQMYITISGMNHYFGMEPFVLGGLIYCEKEPGNQVDQEAIRAILPILGTVGYVANSSFTVIQGTYSAGRVYDKVGDGFFARVMFCTEKQIICRVETDKPDLLQMELTAQMMELTAVDPSGPVKAKSSVLRSRLRDTNK